MTTKPPADAAAAFHAVRGLLAEVHVGVGRRRELKEEIRRVQAAVDRAAAELRDVVTGAVRVGVLVPGRYRWGGSEWDIVPCPEGPSRDQAAWYTARRVAPTPVVDLDSPTPAQDAAR